MNMANEYHLKLEWANRYPQNRQLYEDQARDISMQFVLELGKLGSAQERKELEQQVSLYRPLRDAFGEMISLRKAKYEKQSLGQTDLSQLKK